MSLLAIRIASSGTSSSVVPRGWTCSQLHSYARSSLEGRSKPIPEHLLARDVGACPIRPFSTTRRARQNAPASASAMPTPPTSFHKRQEEAAESLRPILDELPNEIDFAVAYGSGVMKQANPTGPPPMIDLLLSTPSSVNFHTSNLRLNPTHYPTHARVFGPRWISHVQDAWGAGAWYIPQVYLAGKSVKYGVVSTSTLLSDLTSWNTFYFAGRLQKPTVTLTMSKVVEDDLQAAIKTNDAAALALALCLIPESTFPEIQLWEKIAGLSYAGDPRMGLGAENPDKVKNIVRGPGALEGFREKYGPLLAKMKFGFEGQGSPKGAPEWIGAGEMIFKRPNTPSFLLDTVTKLPMGMRDRLTVVEPAKDQTQVREDLLSALQRISGPPALRQSVKGLLTAGITKSIVYGLAKLRKGSAGRQR